MLYESLSKALEPIVAKRKELAAIPGAIKEILAEGNKKAGKVAKATMDEVKEAVGLGGL